MKTLINDTAQMDTPFLSIVTVSRNSEQHLEQTIRSVVNQTYNNIEYIIIDGASTDGTLEIIKKYQDKISYWQSETDGGIAEAMNKGLLHATGQFVLFLNSDDYLAGNDAIKKVIPYLSGHQDIFGFRIFFLIDGIEVMAEKLEFDWRTNFKSSVYHQATFCKKTLFDRLGGFDTSYSIGMDYDFFLRCYRKGIQAKIVDMPFSVMRKDGISSQKNWDGLKERFRQEELVQRMNGRGGDKLVSWLFWRVYIPFKYISYTLGKV